jgi:hypothetical protein
MFLFGFNNISAAPLITPFPLLFTIYSLSLWSKYMDGVEEIGGDEVIYI